MCRSGWQETSRSSPWHRDSDIRNDGRKLVCKRRSSRADRGLRLDSVIQRRQLSWQSQLGCRRWVASVCAAVGSMTTCFFAGTVQLVNTNKSLKAAGNMTTLRHPGVTSLPDYLWLLARQPITWSLINAATGWNQCKWCKWHNYSDFQTIFRSQYSDIALVKKKKKNPNQ